MVSALPAANDRRQLQQIVAGLTEGVILIEPDQSIAWANDAALSMHGVNTLAELGMTVDDYRARFKLRYRNNRKLKKGHTPIERVVAGETFRDVTVEVTPLGKDDPEWTHQVRSLVLTNEAGDPECLVLIMHDVTERFEAEERFETSFNVNPAPALICRLEDQLYVKVNQGFLQLTGYERADVIGSRLSDIDVLADCAQADEYRPRLGRGESVPQTEACLHLPDGRKKAVIVAGQPIEIAGAPCMMFTFMDLDPRKGVEEELRLTRAKSQADFESLYNEAPVPLHSLDSNQKLVSVSDRWLALLGYARNEVLGRSITEFLSPRTTRVLSDRHGNEPVETGSFDDCDYEFVKKTGELVDVSVSARVVLNEQGRVQRTMVAVIDVTERKQTEQRFQKTFDLAPIPMIVADLGEHRVINANRAFLEVVGRPLNAVAYRPLAEIGLNDTSNGRPDLERLLNGTNGLRERAMTVETAAADVLDCLVSAEKVVIQGKDCALLVIQDVTERRQSEAQLFEAIEAVMNDTTWFSRTVIEKLLRAKRPASARSQEDKTLGALTKREQEIVGLISQGRSNAEISKELTLSLSTIRNHVGTIYGKLGVHNRSGAVVWARERGILGSTGGKSPKTKKS
ncbi:PAS domain S-box protein [Acidisoma sp. L85]|uniref:PAS domain S-box protein n=1 Tax=Acidisoma sp. L85 TaxID=1641850 RepID=UPI00131C11B1|nr:PAS domain S-box protein [Acidisoma sp. L85]